MAIERKNGTTFKGNGLTLSVKPLKSDKKPPISRAVAGDLSEVSLASSVGKNPLDYRGPFS
jgi:hypothetical protein